VEGSYMVVVMTTSSITISPLPGPAGAARGVGHGFYRLRQIGVGTFGAA